MSLPPKPFHAVTSGIFDTDCYRASGLLLEILNFFTSHLKDTLTVLFFIIYKENIYVLRIQQIQSSPDTAPTLRSLHFVISYRG